MLEKLLTIFLVVAGQAACGAPSTSKTKDLPPDVAGAQATQPASVAANQQQPAPAVQPPASSTLVLKFLAYVAGPAQCTQLAVSQGYQASAVVTKWLQQPGSTAYVTGCFVWASHL